MAASKTDPAPAVDLTEVNAKIADAGKAAVRQSNGGKPADKPRSS